MHQEEKRIYIVGQHRLQNEMMASFIGNSTGVDCRVEDDICKVPPGKRNGLELILFDCSDQGADALLSGLRSEKKFTVNRLLALFNVREAMEIEKETLALGVRGFFYDHDGSATLLKGVDVIFDNQLWLSRKKFTEVLERGFEGPTERKKISGGLTARETEILKALALGIPNEMIAKELCISPHTVKTHIYHIFRKISVKNRIQAARWAMNHLL
jgi:LuxR family transcriptional regulator of csgAB operon